MRIFLTGGTGFIGKNLNEMLCVEHDVFLYKRGMSVEREMSYYQPEIIIHSAAEIYDRSKMVGSNILLTYAILEYCSNNPHVRLIYLGSSSEYGKTDKPMSEEDAVNPVSPYAATKACGTMLCQGYSKAYKFECSIIRPFSVYGNYEPKHRLIPKLFDPSAGEINVINGYHDFFYIVDFCHYFHLLLNDDRQYYGEIFNFGYGEQRSNREVVSVVEQITNRRIKVQYIDKWKECDSEYWVCDNSLLRKTYGEAPRYNLEQGLTHLYKNY